MMPAERITMAPGARDYSTEVCVYFGARDFPAVRHPRSRVREALKRAESGGLLWPLPEGMNDEALEAALYANRRSKRGHRRIEEPDWAGVHRELKRKHVTLMILWGAFESALIGSDRATARHCARYRGRRKSEQSVHTNCTRGNSNI
jgi:transposase